MTDNPARPLRRLVVPPDRRFTLEEISLEVHTLERFEDATDPVVRRHVLDSLDLLSEELIGRRDPAVPLLAERTRRLRSRISTPDQTS